MKDIRLSPSTLNLFLECPRCFWLQINENIHRPRGIFPSLPGGMDLVIKDYFDKHREKNELPPELQGKISAKLLHDHTLLNKWRNWRTGLSFTDSDLGVTLFGALDDCLEDNGKFMPLDYKTRGSAPRDGDSERYYGNQLDCYSLLLQENGYPVGNYGYLVYYFPEHVEENGTVIFNVKPIQLKIDPNRARKTLKDAIKLLSGPIPPHHSECEYCVWGRNNEE